MLADVLSGAGYVRKGFKLLNQPGIRRFVFVPLFINIALFSVAIWYGVSYFDALMERFLPSWLEWARWVIWPLVAISVVVLIFYTFTLFANLISAPFNGVLAERIEARLTGEAISESQGWLTLTRGVLIALRNEIKKIGYLLLWTMPLLVLFFIPGLQILAPPAWMLFSAWMLALEYSDFPMGNHGLNFSQERARLRQHKPLALGFGTAIMLMTMVPFLNFFVVPVGVAGATALWVDHLSGRH